MVSTQVKQLGIVLIVLIVVAVVIGVIVFLVNKKKEEWEVPYPRKDTTGWLELKDYDIRGYDSRVNKGYDIQANKNWITSFRNFTGNAFLFTPGISDTYVKDIPDVDDILNNPNVYRKRGSTLYVYLGDKTLKPLTYRVGNDPLPKVVPTPSPSVLPSTPRNDPSYVMQGWTMIPNADIKSKETDDPDTTFYLPGRNVINKSRLEDAAISAINLINIETKINAFVLEKVSNTQYKVFYKIIDKQPSAILSRKDLITNQTNKTLYIKSSIDYVPTQIVESGKQYILQNQNGWYLANRMNRNDASRPWGTLYASPLLNNDCVWTFNQANDRMVNNGWLVNQGSMLLNYDRVGLWGFWFETGQIQTLLYNAQDGTYCINGVLNRNVSIDNNGVISQKINSDPLNVDPNTKFTIVSIPKPQDPLVESKPTARGIVPLQSVLCNYLKMINPFFATCVPTDFKILKYWPIATDVYDVCYLFKQYWYYVARVSIGSAGNQVTLASRQYPSCLDRENSCPTRTTPLTVKDINLQTLARFQASYKAMLKHYAPNDNYELVEVTGLTKSDNNHEYLLTYRWKNGPATGVENNRKCLIIRDQNCDQYNLFNV
jgi:hypothetical protein